MYRDFEEKATDRVIEAFMANEKPHKVFSCHETSKHEDTSGSSSENISSCKSNKLNTENTE